MNSKKRCECKNSHCFKADSQSFKLHVNQMNSHSKSKKKKKNVYLKGEKCIFDGKGNQYDHWSQ